MTGLNPMIFSSGKSWLEVLKTPPKGNAYYILAHQYIAAKLNILNGTSSTEVDEAIAWAEGFFSTYTLEEASKLKPDDPDVRWRRSMPVPLTNTTTAPSARDTATCDEKGK
jgi:hypothetical protein